MYKIHPSWLEISIYRDYKEKYKKPDYLGLCVFLTFSLKALEAKQVHFGLVHEKSFVLQAVDPNQINLHFPTENCVFLQEQALEASSMPAKHFFSQKHALDWWAL